MASLLDVANCGGTTGTFNSGYPICDVIRGIPLMVALADSGFEFSEAEMASPTAFAAAWAAGTTAPRGNRLYPIKSLTNFEDLSKEATKISLGNLTNSEIEGVEAVPAFGFQHRKGELYHRQLAKAESENLKLYIVDKQYVVYGTRTAGKALAPFSVTEFKAGLPKFGTPAAASYYPFAITLSELTEYKENGGFFQATSAIVGSSGLVDVVLSEFAFATNVLKVGLTALGGKNLTDLYSTELQQATAWIVKNKTTGLAVTVSSAFDSTNKVMALTLSGTPFTGAASGDEFTCDLNIPSVLAATPISISGYESTGPITVEKP